MIKISRNELDNLEKLNSGAFGSIYKKDEYSAYKIYHTTISSYYGGYMINPCLKLSRKRYDRLIEVSKELQYTDGILDIVIVDNRFKGIYIPYYYEGKELFKMMDAPFTEKVDLSKQLVRNVEELHSYYIYPCDFKLNNLINDHGELKIIDLDDVLTHVCFKPNTTYLNNSILTVIDTIQRFLNEAEHVSVPNDVLSRLKRFSKQPVLSHRYLEEYISEKEKPRDILFIDSTTDLAELANMHLDSNFSIVYLIDFTRSNKAFRNILNQLDEKDIPLYDFLKKHKKDEYFRLENIRSVSEIKNHVLVRK